MFNRNSLSTEICDIIVKLCAVLHSHGYQQVPIGAMMRLLGVDPAQAEKHDNEYFELDSDFLTLMEQQESVTQPPPPGTILH